MLTLLLFPLCRPDSLSPHPGPLAHRSFCQPSRPLHVRLYYLCWPTASVGNMSHRPRDEHSIFVAKSNIAGYRPTGSTTRLCPCDHIAVDNLLFASLWRLSLLRTYRLPDSLSPLLAHPSESMECPSFSKTDLVYHSLLLDGHLGHPGKSRPLFHRHFGGHLHDDRRLVHPSIHLACAPLPSLSLPLHPFISHLLQQIQYTILNCIM